MSGPVRSTFFTAQWSDLIFITVRAEKEPLAPLLPSGIELDEFEGSTFVSLVAFRFSETAFGGIRVPLFHSFAQLNVRVYVRQIRSGLPGVVFLHELCPYAPVAWTARLVFNERLKVGATGYVRDKELHSYRFSQGRGREKLLEARACGPESEPKDGSLEQFIVERFHGFSRAWLSSRDAHFHYQVAHPSWPVSEAVLENFEPRFEDFYPPPLAALFRRSPCSVIYSPGSTVQLSWPALRPSGAGELQPRMFEQRGDIIR